MRMISVRWLLKIFCTAGADVLIGLTIKPIYAKDFVQLAVALVREAMEG